MRKKRRSAYLLESLEARLLFSADLAPLPVDGGTSGAEFESGLEISLQPDGAGIQEADEKTQERQEVIFVDSGIDDYQQLIIDLESQYEKGRQFNIVGLDSGHDGIAQISDYLNQQQGVAAVHIISHGADGEVFLGNSRLNSTTLDGYAEAIEGWQRALSSDADLLFYGCNLAAGQDGQELVNSLTLLTGADVAASDDITGSAKFGGDWVLEYGKGEIETAVAINSETQQSWSGMLATFTVNTTADTVDANPGDGIAEDASGNISLRSAIMEANALGGANEIILNAGTYTLSLGPAGDDAAANGDLDVTGELTITGAGAAATVIDANSLDRVFHLKGNAANLTLTDLTVQGGSINNKGGGIFVDDALAQLTATRVIVTGNIADNGAGIFNRGTMTLTDVVLSNNGDATTNEGGGIHNKKVAILERVTISGNHADKGGGDGGGIHNDNGADSLSLKNVTFSGNSASDKGGGLHTQTPVTIVNSTFTLNSATTGGGITNNGSTVNIKNTIVAENLASSDPDVEGSFNSQGYNLIGDKGATTDFIDGVNGDQVGTGGSPVDPMLGTLQDNGGFAPTHALLAGSPAIDPVGLSGALPLDQRGANRDGLPDIGAFEFGAAIGNNPGTVTIDAATPAQGDTLTANVIDPDGATGAITYQWYRGGVAIAGATSSTYTTVQSDVGAAITVTATYTDDLGSGESPTSAPTASVTNVNDPGSVTIDNTTPAQGDTLTASVTDPDGATGAISYQWFRDGVAIGGATAAGYTTTQADVGKVITVTADYTDDLLTAENLTSAPTLAVTNINDPGTVTIDNTTPAQGDLLTAGVTDPDGATGAISYQWFRDGVAIGGATAATYTTVQADVGKVITVTADYTDDLTTVESLTSAPTLAVTNINDPGTVTIDNTTPAQGDTLTAGVTDPDGATGAISYQWFRDGVAIGGATAAGYTTTQADVGKVITVTADYTDDLLTAESLTSAPTLAVTNINDPGIVTIDNTTPAQGDLLTAGVTDPDGATGAISYQWFRDGVAIGGANAAGYTTTQADVGKVIIVTADYTDDLLTAENLTSAPTLAVTNINDPGTVTIDNTTPAQGDLLTAGVTDPDGATGAIAYQWFSDGVAIGGATAASYMTTQADVGTVITVTANYIDDLDTAESLTSAPTAAVTNINDPGTVTIDNTTPTQGDTLTASVADPDGASSAINYQWYRDGVAIAGATAVSYTTTQADVGAIITVTADYADDLTTVESSTSAGTAAVTNVNETPVAVNDNLTVTEDNSISFTSVTVLLGNDTDIDGDTLTISGFTQPANGTLADNGDGTFTYTPVGNFNGNDSFTYTISDGNGETATGAAIILVAPVGDTPQVTNVSTFSEVQSGLIFINPNASDGAEVTHFKLSGITNGTLYLADSVTRIDNGDFITVGQGQAGLKFTPAEDSTADGSFNVESSEDGVSVASQSGIATSIISVLTIAPPPSAPEQRPPQPEPEQVVSEEVVQEESEVVEDVADETDVPADADNMFSVETPQSSKATGTAKPSLVPGVSALKRADFDSNDDKTPNRSTLLSPQTLKMLIEAENLGELKTALGKLDITTLPPDVYELVRGSLDAVKEEIGKEILLGHTVLGSAIATSVGLSAGYVVWMLKGGSLLASVLSSLPAWQLADPLAILVGKKEDENDDDESLKTIIEEGSGRDEDKKRKASELDNVRKESAKR